MKARAIFVVESVGVVHDLYLNLGAFRKIDRFVDNDSSFGDVRSKRQGHSSHDSRPAFWPPADTYQEHEPIGLEVAILARAEVELVEAVSQMDGEYLEKQPDGYRYTQVCEIYRQWLSRQRLSMRQVYRDGEKLFVDDSGKKPRIWDPTTGERASLPPSPRTWG